MTADTTVVNFEQLRQLESRLEAESQDIANQHQRIGRQLIEVENSGWQGAAASQFLNEMHAEILPTLRRTFEALALSAETLRSIMQIFDEAQNEAAQLFGRQDDLTGQLIQRIGALLPPDLTRSLESDGLANFLKTAGAGFLEFLSKGLENPGDMRANFRLIGRELNKLLETRGYVGKMDELYKAIFKDGLPKNGVIAQFLKADWFKGALTGVDGLFGFFGDLKEGTYGGDYLKTGGVNIVDALIQSAVTDNPYGKAITIGSAVNQITTGIETGILRTNADLIIQNPQIHDSILHYADLMDAAREKMDVGSITKQLSEGVYEYFANYASGVKDLSAAYISGFSEILQHPSSASILHANQLIMGEASQHMEDLLLPPLFTRAGRNNLGDALKATANVVDGWVDYRVASTAAWSTSVYSDVMEFAFPPGSRERAPVMVGISQANQTILTPVIDWLTNLIDIQVEH